MSYYLIGIGGTGARCMEAFIHLCGAGLLEDSQPVKLVYVDADVSCGNLTKTQETADFYEKAREIGFSKSGMFKNNLESAKLWTPVEEKRNTMDEVFQYNSLVNRKDTQALGYLYESLYTEQERTTNLDKGFRGHPAIGSAVINQKMSEKEEPWNDLLPQINADKDAKIFLFASVFGGTGAAGFPTIAKLLKKVLKKDTDGRCIAHIGGALVLPYFQFPAASGSDTDEMQAKVDEFMLNTKSALDYYDKSGLLEIAGKGNGVFTSIYMVGDNDLSEVKTFSLGAREQKNAANFVELYAALAAFDFFNKKKYDIGATPMIGRAEDNGNAIEWEDLPNVCMTGNLKDKLSAFVKVLYVYKHGVLPSLEECAKDQKHKRQVAWYRDLVEKAGNIDVYENRAVMDQFTALGDYTDRFFDWMKDINTSSKRQVNLVNKQACNTDGLAQKLFPLDAHEVILPITKGKDRLTHKEFWQRLCDYAKKMDKTNASGAEVLMQAVYEICSDQDKKN